jgi:hypothetical protein
MISLFPTYIIHSFTILIIIATVAIFTIPIPETYKKVYQISIVLLLGVVLFVEGSISNEAKWKLKIAEAEKKIAEIAQQSAEANTKLAETTAENERLIEEVKNASKTEIIKVEKVINRDCKVHPNAIQAHNQSLRKLHPKKRKK